MGAQVWGYTDYEPTGESWQEVELPDARPGWGILSDGGLWTRHRSNGINYQRGRANVIADSLLCADFCRGTSSSTARSICRTSPRWRKP